jgi:long-subunit acyl-CoA synthetase (AMP-forming)
MRGPRIECADAIELMPALAAQQGPAPDVRPGLDDIAALNYTGGTTGLPKGCIHTQRDMLYTRRRTSAPRCRCRPTRCS